jgi:leader peptidase (prepilin peptidase)/N-methyltransferase
MLLWGLIGLTASWFIYFVADDSPLDKPLRLPHCPQCDTPRDPPQWSGVAAFLQRRRRCRNCGWPITWRWPITELLSVLVCLVLFIRIGPVPILPVVTLYTLVLLLIAIIDFEHRLILSRVIFPAIAAAFALSFVTPGMTPVSAVLGGLIGFALTGLIYLGGRVFVLLQARRGRIIDEVAFGQGDVWLMLFVGLITGVSGVMGALVLGILIGGVVAVAIILYGAAQRQSKLYVPYAYGPYLALAGWLVLMQGALIVPPG